MKRIAMIAILLIPFLAGCDKEQDTFVPPQTEISEGLFSILPAPDSAGIINLGQIHNTTSFPFLLRNVGDYPLTNIAIQNSDSMFVITSLLADSLPAGANPASAELFTVAAVHGTYPSGLGITTTMPPGANFDTLTVTGTTRDDHNRPSGVSFRAVIKVTAMLADIRLFDDTTEIDLTKPDGETTGSGITTEEFFDYPLTSAFATIRNSGNVVLDIAQYAGFTKADERLVQPGGIDSVQAGNVVVIDTRGTVSIASHLHIASDGKCYFGLD